MQRFFVCLLTVAVACGAFAAEPLAAGRKQTLRLTGDLLIAEVHGAPARVLATLTATSSRRIAEKQYDLAPFEERSIGVAEVLRSLGPIDATFEIEGEGQVIVHVEAADPVPPFDTTPSVTQQLLTSPFQAAPLRDPATGLVFIRNRWYDPNTGTFLTPDPLGYQDSSNLYAFGGGDPVNNRDPSGLAVSVGKSGTFVVTDKRTGAGKAYRIPREWAQTHKLAMVQILVHAGGMLPAQAMNLMDAQGVGISRNGPETLGALSVQMNLVDAALKEVATIYAVTAAGVASGGVGSAALTAAGATQFTAATGGLFLSGVAAQGTGDAINGTVSSIDTYLQAGATTVAVGWAFQGGAWVLKNAAANEVGAIGDATPSIVLRQNLKASGIRPPPFPNAAHHIVAAGDEFAIASRQHLAFLGININDASNGVFLRYTGRGTGANHRVIHTRAYYAAVDARILSTRTADEARAVLRQIAQELQAGTFPF